jgi:hypothetical protein
MVTCPASSLDTTAVFTSAAPFPSPIVSVKLFEPAPVADGSAASASAVAAASIAARFIGVLLVGGELLEAHPMPPTIG